MKTYLLKYWNLLILLVPLTLLVISIWDSNYYIGGDLIIPLNPVNAIEKISLWENGNESFSYVELFLRLIYFIPSLLGIPAFVIHKVLIVILFVIGFVFTYLAFKELFRGTDLEDGNLAYLAGVVYTFSPAYFMVVNAYLPLYGFPVCFYFLLRYFKQNKIFDAILFSAALNFYFFSELPQPKLSVVLSISVLVLSSVYSYLHSISYTRTAVNLLKISLISALLNLWVIVPILFSLSFGTLGGLSTNISEYGGLADLNIASLEFMVSFFNKNVVDYYPKLTPFLMSPLFTIFMLGRWAMLIFGIFLIRDNKKIQKLLCYLLLGVLLFVFIAKGANPPMGEIYKYLVNKVLFFGIFRTTSTAILGAGFFFSCAVAVASYTFSKKFKNFVYIYAVINIVLFYPIYFGFKFYNQSNANPMSKGYHIPNEYFELGRKLDELEGDSKILSLPLIEGYVSKKWSYFGPDLLNQITGKQLLYRSDAYGLSLKNKTVDISSQRNSSSTELNNIGHILLQKDSVSGGRPLVLNQDLGNPIVTNAYFDLYKVRGEHITPQVHVQSDMAYLSGDGSKLYLVADFSDFQKGLGTYFTPDDRGPMWSTDNQPFPKPSHFFSVWERLNKSVSLEQLKWHKGWAWPQASVNPLSFKYKLVAIKEYLETLKNRKLPDRVNIWLWLSTKRIEELRIFKLPPEVQTQLVIKYHDLNQLLVTALKSVEEDDRDVNYWSLVKKTLLYMRKSSEVYSSLEYKPLVSENPTTAYNDFLSWIENTSHFSCDEYCYEIKVPYDGSYHVYLNRKGLSELADHLAEISIEIKGIKTLVNESTDEKDWHNFGSVDLKKGEVYRAHLSLPKPRNLLISEGTLPKSKVENEVSLDFHSQFVSLDYPLVFKRFDKNIVSGNQPYFVQEGAKHLELNGWLGNERYLVSADYYTDSGSMGISLTEKLDAGPKERETATLYNSNEQKLVNKVLLNEKLRHSYEFNSFGNLNTVGCSYVEDGLCFIRYEKVVVSSREATGASFFIYSFPDYGKFSEARVRNLRIEKVFDPVIVSRTSRETGEYAEILNPTIDYRKVNNTKYKVYVKNVSQPYTLVFNEGFHSGWKLYLNPNQGSSNAGNLFKIWETRISTAIGNIFNFDRPFETLGMSGVAKNNHYLVNGFANSWYILPEETGTMKDYELIIEFFPQRIFYISVVISFLTLAVLLIHLSMGVIVWLKNKLL